jgi:hypothetical protein
MAHRLFKDASGREWEVWDVVPSKWVGPTLDGGWLAFQSGEDRRRLNPLPLYWVSAPEEELRELLGRAKPVSVRPDAQ